MKWPAAARKRTSGSVGSLGKRSSWINWRRPPILEPRRCIPSRPRCPRHPTRYPSPARGYPPPSSPPLAQARVAADAATLATAPGVRRGLQPAVARRIRQQRHLRAPHRPRSTPYPQSAVRPPQCAV
eukprot:scaffold45752_cov35-Tisochrysis_lutea.AAC.5